MKDQIPENGRPGAQAQKSSILNKKLISNIDGRRKGQSLENGRPGAQARNSPILP
jgi:hypothetical protein